MRVLQIIDNLHPGGAERMAVNLANALQEKIELSALCCTREEGFLKDSISPSVTYLFANRKGRIGIGGLWEIVKFIYDHQITHLHAHSTSIYTAYLLKLKYPKLRLIWHDHYGNAEFLASRPIKKIKFVASKIDAVIAVNQFLKDWSIKNQLCADVNYLTNFAQLSRLDKKGGYIPGVQGKRVVCLANLRLQKNQLLLLEVWKEMKHIFPDWSLLLVGKRFNDNYEDELEKQIHKYQLEGNVFILGSRIDVGTILKSSDIGVLSSTSEGLPVALLEYGLASLPVVVTDVGACREVVRDFGIIVQSKDSETFKKELIRLIENSTLRKEKAVTFHNHIIKEYSAGAYIDKLIDIYKKQ